MRSAVLVGPLVAVALFSGVAIASDEPRAVGEAFCKARLGNDEAATLGLLTPSLKKAIEEAEARRDIIAKAAPDEKPPLGDGIPYQAFPDVAETCEVGDVIETAGHIEVQVRYSFADTPGAGWTDRLKLVTEGGKLLVDDVIYANVANGEPGLGLRQILFEAFDQ
jgi:hypothetical protein